MRVRMPGVGKDLSENLKTLEAVLERSDGASAQTWLLRAVMRVHTLLWRFLPTSFVRISLPRLSRFLARRSNSLSKRIGPHAAREVCFRLAALDRKRVLISSRGADGIEAYLLWVSENGDEGELRLLRRPETRRLFNNARLKRLARWAEEKCEERIANLRQGLGDNERQAAWLMERLVLEEMGLTARLDAARELSRLGQWSRDDLATRGSLTRAGANRVPGYFNYRDLFGVVERAASTDLRCQVLVAIGEWCGPEAVSSLETTLEQAEHDDVRAHAVLALQTIGGEGATEVLRNAASSNKQPETARSAALRALLQLATGGRVGYTEGLPIPDEPQRPIVPALAETLNRIKEDREEPWKLRQQAEELLCYVAGLEQDGGRGVASRKR